jgi:hypothetical protein
VEKLNISGTMGGEMCGLGVGKVDGEKLIIGGVLNYYQ